MMPTLIPLAIGIHLAVPLLVTLLLFQIYRRFRTSYVLQWALSFASLTFFLALNIPSASAPASWQLPLSAIAGAAAYLQLGWLISGFFEVARRRPLAQRDNRRIVLLLAAAGLVSGAVPFLLGGDAMFRQGFSTGLHALAMAATLAVSAVAVRRLRGSGFTVPAIAFGAFALLRFADFVEVMRAVVTHAAAVAPVVAAAAEAIAGAIAALGMVLTVLEDQREAASLASSEVERLAYYDVLTGLPNRNLFSDRLAVALAHAGRHAHKLAVFFLDIDRFKQINDSLGHTTGDRLLKVLATRVRNCVREEDTVARFGGDEMTVLIHIIGKSEDAAKIAQKILDAIRPPITLDDREFVMSSSIGIAVYPTDGTDGVTLIRNADAAMYRAKALGGNTYQFYAATMNHKALEALEVENGLRRALQECEFLLYYQPLVDLQSGLIFGFEALIRWQHPELGLLRPDRFIPAAEQSGIIIAIGRWVIHEACRQAAEWHRRGHRIVVAVNLSARQFQDTELISHVTDALESAALPPEFLELEITEGYAMQDVERAIAVLRQLKSLGVRIAIDDFGTGYSCLSYLKQFPIDTVKLDRSFVRDFSSPEDAQIALGVIALAHSLKLKVIAEGVETINQLKFLREHSCDRLQGYLFSRPLPSSNFEALMDQRYGLRVPMSH